MAVLWALDVDSDNRPYRAHRIIDTGGDGAGRVGEVRTAACGIRFTAGNHPRGWWWTADGRLPLGGPDCIHCGGEQP